MKKSKVREWWVRTDWMEVRTVGEHFYGGKTGREILPHIHVREVIELTDDQKEWVRYIKRMPTSKEEFLIDLLERAGVINE